MKVSVTLQIDVDEDVWCDVWGVARTQVRDDVKSYVANAILNCGAAEDDCFRAVTVR